MRLSFAARLLAALALVAASGVPAAAQQASSGHPGNLVNTVTNLVWPAPTDLFFKVDDLAGKTKDLEVKETKTEIHIDLAADVLFDFDKSTLRPTARDALHQAASIIRDNAKGSTVRIDGYTDSKGSDPYNQRLSDRRAESVRNWFVAQEGLKDVNFATKGYGAKNPVAPNTKPDGSDDPVCGELLISPESAIRHTQAAIRPSIWRQFHGRIDSQGQSRYRHRMSAQVACVPVATTDGGGGIACFHLTDTGNVTPDVSISGSDTTLPTGFSRTVRSVWVDSAGNYYASLDGTDAFLWFAAGADGNVAPSSTITGSNLTSGHPYRIITDASGNIWSVSYTSSTVAKYAPCASGTCNTAPSVTLSGSNTQLSAPDAIAFDPSGNLWVANVGSNTLIEFTAAQLVSGGNVAPAGNIISGGATDLDFPYDMAIDTTGNIYVANYSGNSITVYDVGSQSGNVTPNQNIVGAATLLSSPVGVAVDSDSNIYVAQPGNLLSFASGTTGNVAPTTTITGASSLLNCGVGRMGITQPTQE